MKPINVGTRRELMVDDYLLENLSGDAKLLLHNPTPQEIVLEMDRPWETGTFHHGYMTVFCDEDLYKMYYGVKKIYYIGGKRTKKNDERICYAESEDGIHWEKPFLGQFKYQESTDNNILWMADGLDRKGIHGFTPFKDENPACQPERRYKAVARGSGGLYALHSSDGVKWANSGNEPIITEGAFDSQNLVFRDKLRGEYRAYWRDFFKTVDGTRYRGIRTAISPDFLNWSRPQWLYYPGAETEELYTNQVIPYFRAPHIFVGFPTRYVERRRSKAIEGLPEWERRRKIMERSGMERIGTALTDTLFMSSRDGENFNRWGEAFVRPGLRHANNWFYGDNYVNWGIVTTSSAIEKAPDELSFYISEASRISEITQSEPDSESPFQKDKRFRRYTLRMDGFVSVNASRRGGEVVTCPIVFEGDNLTVNFSASAAGSISVEIQDIHGVPIQGFTLEDNIELLGDDLERRVRWKDNPDLAALKGVPVRLRFQLADADLYAFQFNQKPT